MNSSRNTRWMSETSTYDIYVLVFYKLPVIFHKLPGQNPQTSCHGFQLVNVSVISISLASGKKRCGIVVTAGMSPINLHWLLANGYPITLYPLQKVIAERRDEVLRVGL